MVVFLQIAPSVPRAAKRRGRPTSDRHAPDLLSKRHTRLGTSWACRLMENAEPPIGPIGNLSSMNPLLTIAIPTWNREAYLEKNLQQLQSETVMIHRGLVEIIVSDNCSTDGTARVVEPFVHSGVVSKYIRNVSNIGWALNFAQCFDHARGRYVLLLGDDDFLCDGALVRLLQILEAGEFGVVCLRAYGFDVDFRLEYPGNGGGLTEFSDPNEFFLAVNRRFTLLSACVLNKSLIPDIDSKQFADTNLAAFHLVLRAGLASKRNLKMDAYMLACKRQNSFSYDWVKVFVEEFWRIMDTHIAYGLSPDCIRRIEQSRLLSYYPFYAFDLRMWRRSDPTNADRIFSERFGGRLLYDCWVAPILKWPRVPAIVWGALVTFFGRLLGGDFGRGIAFARHRILRVLRFYR